MKKKNTDNKKLIPILVGIAGFFLTYYYFTGNLIECLTLLGIIAVISIGGALLYRLLSRRNKPRQNDYCTVCPDCDTEKCPKVIPPELRGKAIICQLCENLVISCECPDGPIVANPRVTENCIYVLKRK